MSTEQLLRRLSGHPHLAAYDKRHLPKRLHYANNIRIDDVIITMDDEWVVSRSVHRPWPIALTRLFGLRSLYMEWMTFPFLSNRNPLRTLSLNSVLRTLLSPNIIVCPNYRPAMFSSPRCYLPPLFRFSVALRPQKPPGSPGRPSPLSHTSWALTLSPLQLLVCYLFI